MAGVFFVQWALSGARHWVLYKCHHYVMENKSMIIRNTTMTFLAKEYKVRRRMFRLLV